jgi:hypothetical protein
MAGNHKLKSVEIVKMDRDSLVYKGKGCFTVLHGSRWMLFLREAVSFCDQIRKDPCESYQVENATFELLQWI